MKKLAAVAIGLLGLAGCDVNVTSNDARTRDTINDVQGTVGELANTAEDAVGRTAEDLRNVARDTGGELQEVGNAIQGAGERAGDRIETETEASNRAN